MVIIITGIFIINFNFTFNFFAGLLYYFKECLLLNYPLIASSTLILIINIIIILLIIS